MKIPALFALGVAAALAGGCSRQPEVMHAAQPAPVAVAFGRVTTVDLPQPHEAGGVLRARDTATIASRVMAPITRVHARPGDLVRRGARLITLDARESAANDARAAAAQAAAVEASRSAEADARSAEAQLRLARATHARISGLYDKRSATAQELDQAVAALAAAEAQLASAQARTAAARASHDASQAARDAASVGMSYSVLTAPFDGVVTERRADPGSMATPGLPLLTIEDPSLYRLEVEVDEARAGSIHVGQTVQYRLDHATGDQWRTAEVSEIGRVDATTHSFLVKIDLPAGIAARSGSFGRLRFPGPSRRTLAVPRAAVARRGQLAIVFSVDNEGRARLRPLNTGLEVNGHVEILAGLADNDVIILNPPAGLVDGTLVVPQ